MWIAAGPPAALWGGRARPAWGWWSACCRAGPADEWRPRHDRADLRLSVDHCV